MKQARILALTIGSILFLGLVMYGFKANSSDNNLFGTKLINNNPPNIQLNTEEEIRHLRDIVEELKNILRITLEILEQDDPDYAFMKTEFRKAQYLLKDLKRNNLDSTDIIIYRDKYIDLFTDIVHKAVEAKKKKTSTMPSKEVAKIKELEEKLKDIDDKSGYNIYNSLLGAAEVGNSEQVSILNEIINSMKGQIEGFKNMINDLSNENRRLKSENKRLIDENKWLKSKGKANNLESGLLNPLIELYDGGRFFREGKRISYEPNQCLATKVRKRKSLKAYLVIPKVVLGSKTQINIFGTASTATVDILIYEAGNKISSKTLTLLRDEVTSMEITDLISKSRKDKSCKDYRIEIQKSKRNYTLNNSFHFKL